MDITVTYHGSIVMIAVETESARRWVETNVPLEPWQWMGNTFPCEPRYLEDLITGMRDDGLEVS